MGSLSERVLNYAKEVNGHGNGVIYYKGNNHEQYEMAASFFSVAPTAS